MTAVHHLSRRDARRIAVRAQLLASPRPTDLLAVVRHLGMVQADPTNAVAPSAELVAWSRLGSTYRLGDLTAAVEEGSLVELEGRLRPAEDLALHRAEMAAWPGPGKLRDWQEAQVDWVQANDDCRRDILARLYDDGPLPTRALPDGIVVPWHSTGWNNHRSVRMLLNLMVRRGEVAVAGRRGRDPLWDLAERVYPDDPVVPLDEAVRIRDERRLRSLGIVRATSKETPGAAAVVDGVPGSWRVDPALLDHSGPDHSFAGRTVLLSPLDQLVFDRKRVSELFEFDYQLEMYKPAAKRRWGYWAMPVLHGDRLVGKLDATADRDAGVLRVDAIHEDGAWTRTLRTAVDREVRELGGWLGLRVQDGAVPAR